MIRSDDAVQADDVTGFKPRHTSPHVCDSADDLMAWNARVSSRHHAVPFVASSVKVQAADFVF